MVSKVDEQNEGRAALLLSSKSHNDISLAWSMREISYLIPVDSYSKWPEFIPTNSTTTDKVINSLIMACQKLLCPEMLDRFRGVSSQPKWSEEKRDSDFKSDNSFEPSDKEILDWKKSTEEWRALVRDLFIVATISSQFLRYSPRNKQ
ncbi:hypothetical protein ACTXT7_014490 [Hymenolepis weldensis]